MSIPTPFNPLGTLGGKYEFWSSPNLTSNTQPSDDKVFSSVSGYKGAEVYKAFAFSSSNYGYLSKTGATFYDTKRPLRLATVEAYIMNGRGFISVYGIDGNGDEHQLVDGALVKDTWKVFQVTSAEEYRKFKFFGNEIGYGNGLIKVKLSGYFKP